MAGLHFDITGDNSNLMDKLRQTENGIRQTSRSIEQSGMSIEQMFSRLSTAAAGFGAAFSAQQFASQVMKVRGEFQQLELAFETMLGSAEKASFLMSQLTRTAAITRFGLQDVAGGAKQLLAYGVAADNVNDTLVRLGDIAAGLSIPLSDLIYVYGTTKTQGRMLTRDVIQFTGRGVPLIDELAKQFGVTKDKVSELVESGKVGFDQMHKAIVALTSDGGKFGGLMSKQSQTITGQIENIKDRIEQAFNQMGQSSEGVINSALGGVSKLVENWEKVADAIGYAATSYGFYKAAIMTQGALNGVRVDFSTEKEIEGYRQLLGIKQDNKNADLEAAVASGSLTQAKAGEIAAIREEIRERLALLQAKKAEAAEEAATALKAFEIAKHEKEAADEKLENMYALMEAADQQGDASYIAYAQEQLQTASANANTAATRLNTAEKELNTASSKAKAAAQAADTFATNVNTVANNANTKSLGLMKAAALQLQTILKGLWATLMANPLAIVIGAVGLLAYGVYKFATRETEAEKATKGLNEALDAQSKKYEEQKKKVDDLVSTIGKLDISEGTRIGNLQKLKREYPQILKDINTENDFLREKHNILQAINKEQGKQKQQDDIKLLEEAEKKLQRFRDARARGTSTTTVDMDGDGWAFENADKAIVEQLKTVNKLKAKVAEPAKESFLENLSNLKDEKIDNTIEEITHALQALEGAGEDAVAPIIELGHEFSKSQLKDMQLALQGEKEQRSGKKQTGNQWLSQYKKDYEAAAKAVTDFMNQKNDLTESQFEKKLKELTDKRDTAKKKYEEAGGSVKGDSKAEDERKKKEEKAAEELLSIRRQNQQTEIDLMKEGSAKRLAQIDLDYQRELDAIKKQEKEWRDAQKGKLTTEQQQILTDWDVRATEKADADINKVNEDKLKAERKAQQQLLIQFGNYQEQRKGIEQKYADMKAETEVEGEKELLDKQMEAELNALDEKFGYTTAAMAELFEDASQKSVNSIQAIIDKYEMLVSYNPKATGDEAKAARQKLLDAGISEKDIEALEKGEISIKDLTDRIKELKGELNEKSPWKAFTGDLSDAIKKIKQANGDTTKLGVGISGIGSSVSSFAPALKEFSSNISNIFGFDDGKIQSAIDGLDGLGQTAQGVGQIMSGDIVGGAMAAVGGISKMVDAFEGIFGADYSSYNRLVEEYNGLIDVWDKLIDRKLEYIDIDYGDEARKAGQEALEIINKEIDAYRTLGKERLNAGASAGSHSIGMRIKKYMSDEGWEQYNKAMSDIGLDADWVAKGRMELLFEMSAEQLEQLQEKAPVFWSKLDEDVREYLEKIIESNEQLEETERRLKEVATGISFDSFYDSFSSTLLDMDSSAKDFADNFEEYLKQSILSSIVANKYRDKIQSLYDEWAKKSDTDGDGAFDLTAAESEELKEAQKALAEQMMAERDALADTFGWEDTYSQEASSKGFQAMNQDTGEELNGRFTALQISNEEIKNQMVDAVNTLTQMVAVSSQGNIVLSEILTQQALANIYLADIVKYTKAASLFGTKLDTIIENTKNL